MTESLFRQEVLDARQTRWLGVIALGQPLSLWLLTACAAAAIVLFLIIGEFTRRTRVDGQLVAYRATHEIGGAIDGCTNLAMGAPVWRCA